MPQYLHSSFITRYTSGTGLVPVTGTGTGTGTAAGRSGSRVHIHVVPAPLGFYHGTTAVGGISLSSMHDVRPSKYRAALPLVVAAAGSILCVLGHDCPVM